MRCGAAQCRYADHALADRDLGADPRDLEGLVARTLDEHGRIDVPHQQRRSGILPLPR